MRQAALLCCSALATMLSLSGCSEGRSREVLATVLSVRGEVSASHKTNSFGQVKPGDLLATGHAVHVSHGAEMDVALLPGLLLRVSGDSEFTIDRLTIVKDGNETQGGMVSRVGRIHLNRGGATVSFQLPDQEAGEVIVVTDYGTINSTVNSLFRIDAAASSTRAICVRGSIHATTVKGRMAVIEQGFFQLWGTAQTEAQPARTDDSVQAESAKAIKAEAALLMIDPPATFHVR